MSVGCFALVLHAHLPFVRHPEHEMHLEERWLFEAIVECYLPILAMLDRLERDGVPTALTMSLTPTLGDMLQDTLLRRRFLAHLGRLEALQRKEARRLGGSSQASVVAMHDAWLATVRATWERHDGDLVAGFVHHHDRGAVELVASAATHAFLPGLVRSPRALRAQIRLGLDAFTAQTGRTATGFWLPECAYHADVDDRLAAEGVGYSIVEEHGLGHAFPRPPAGPHAPVLSPSGVAWFARDLASGRQVWSRHEGYPGDPWYREFYRDIGFDFPEAELLGEIGPHGTRVATGLKYHRITGPEVPLDKKEPYDPDAAKERAWSHAGHFVHSRAAQARWLAKELGYDPSRPGPAGSPPIIVAPYDAELFGHWWFEGPLFLEGVFRHLALPAVAREIEGVTLGGYLRAHPQLVCARPAPSTWGAQGQSRIWTGPANARLWRHVHHAVARVLAAIDERWADATPPARAAIRQAAIELLLLQSSDWSFILAMETSERYAETRWRGHAGRLHALLDAVEAGQIDDAQVATIAARDDFLGALGDRVIEAFRGA